jgi:hypothetical protein
MCKRFLELAPKLRPFPFWHALCEKSAPRLAGRRIEGEDIARRSLLRGFIRPVLANFPRKSQSESGYCRTNDGGKGQSNKGVDQGRKPPPEECKWAAAAEAAAEQHQPQVSATVCGLPFALSVMETLLVKSPSVVEANVTLIVHVAPCARLEPHVLVWLKEGAQQSHQC